MIKWLGKIGTEPVDAARRALSPNVFLPKHGLLALLAVALLGCPESPQSAKVGKPIRSPADVVFDNRWEGDILESEFEEPSGLVFDPQRACLFVVGDEGDIAQVSLDGEIVQEKHLADADFEGITVAPERDRLYIAVEGDERILEVHPESFKIVRRFELDRKRGNETLFPEGGDGVEGITFVPDVNHPDGGTFFVTNQTFSLEPDAEPSLVAEVELPLSDADKEGITLTPLRHHPFDVIDLSALQYRDQSNTLFVVSDSANTLIEMDPAEREVRRVWAFPGNDQEGIAFDSKGYLYIAQDSGGILKIWPKELSGSGG